MQLGRKIRDLRLRPGLTVQQLAEATGLSKGFVSQVENGRTSPSLATLYDRYGRLTTPGRYVVRLAASTNASVAARCVIIDPDGRASIQVDAKDQRNCRND